MLEAIADSYGISLSELIRSCLPSTVEGADVPEHVQKNATLSEVKDKMKWRYTALHLKDNIARGYCHELLQVEPACHTFMWDYLYPKYLGEAYEVFCRTEPADLDRYRSVVTYLNRWQLDYATVTERGYKGKRATLDAMLRCAKAIHKAEGREAGLAFVARTADRHTLLSGEKQEIIEDARLEAAEEDWGGSFDYGNHSGGFR